VWSEGVAPHATPLTPEHDFVHEVAEACRAVYGQALRAVAVFGSVARRTARPDSDVDLFVVVAGLPRGRRARRATFRAVEDRLAGSLRRLRETGLDVELSPVLRTPEDLAIATPLMLDLTEDAVLLEDRGAVLGHALDDLRQRLRRAGARRVWQGSEWYWDLKPDYRRGDIVRI